MLWVRNKEKAPGDSREPSWQREKDSNPHIRSQSPLCYLYTIPLCSEEQKLLYRFYRVCQQFFFLRNGFYFCTGRSAAVKYFFSGLYSSANITAKKISAWRATQALQCGKSMPDILAFLRRHYPDQVRGIGREYAHLSRLLPAPLGLYRQ